MFLCFYSFPLCFKGVGFLTERSEVTIAAMNYDKTRRFARES